jgi:hypothetical protein
VCVCFGQRERGGGGRGGEEREKRTFIELKPEAKLSKGRDVLGSDRKEDGREKHNGSEVYGRTSRGKKFKK